MTPLVRPAPPGAEQADPVRVLIVDDNADKRVALRAVISPLELTVVEADSGIEGLRCLMAQDFAVILLDVKMPIMDGFQTAALIREREQSEMTPIIFITAHASHETNQADRYTGGAVDFMYAPVQPDELRAKVSVFANLHIKANMLAKSAREVQASADRLRLLTDAAPVGIFQTDSQNRYVYTNPRWSEITNVSAEDAVGQDWDTILGPEGRACLAAEMGDNSAGRAELSHRFAIERPGVPPRVALMTSKVIPDGNGGITGWVGTLADVTAEAGAEAAMAVARDKATETSRVKSDFLATMSHEIRTPMNGVIGMIDLLLESDLDTQQRDYADTVRSSGEALLTIVNDILDFSKVEAGKLEIEEIEFNLPAIVDDVVDLLVGPAQTKGLELLAVIGSSVPAVVAGDPGRVRQVLINLIGNAIKFTQTGKIVVRVTEGEVAGADAPAASSPREPCVRFECQTRCTATVIRFEVSDTGDGIAPEKLELVFQPFAQADTSTSRKYGGTGLGLAISSQLVALMGGDCGVSSRLGAGSDFWFTICVHADAAQARHGSRSPAAGRARVPALIGADRPAPAAASRASPDGLPLLVVDDDRMDTPKAGHVLLAEDNLVNQRVATAMLEHLGFHVDVVADGAEAVKAAARTPYQAIFMDCQMPVLDGYQATSEIRRAQGVSTRTPIIAVTASAMKTDQQRCLAAGMDDYLPKPLSLKALAAILARWTPDGSNPPVAASPAEPLPADPARPVLDAKVVGRLARLGEATGEDLVGQLALLFLADADARVLALRQALAGNDAPAVARSAHTLGGASANLGATELARLCATLATDGAAGDLVGGGAQLDAVEAELGRVRSALGPPTPAP